MASREALSRLRSFFQSPRAAGEEDDRQAAVLLHHLTNGIVFLCTLAVLIVIPFFYERQWTSAMFMAAVLVITLVCRHLLHRGAVRRGAALLLSSLWIVIFLVMIAGKGLGDANITFVIALIGCADHLRSSAQLWVRC
jgi:hypothetical protein